MSVNSDMQPLQARFATQEQAEAAMRKLAALRSDRFRLERAALAEAPKGGGLEAGVFSESAFYDSTALISGDETSSWGDESAGANTGLAEFMLSAHVPSMATEQARTVVEQAGGQVV
jgi:hypothetical protein